MQLYIGYFPESPKMNGDRDAELDKVLFASQILYGINTDLVYNCDDYSYSMIFSQPSADMTISKSWSLVWSFSSASKVAIFGPLTLPQALMLNYHP